MSRTRGSVPIDDYVIDVLMRDLVGHDKQPAAFLVYLWLSGQAARHDWAPIAASLQTIADETGLSKSAAQTAVALLRREGTDLDGPGPSDGHPSPFRPTLLAGARLAVAQVAATRRINSVKSVISFFENPWKIFADEASPSSADPRRASSPWRWP